MHKVARFDATERAVHWMTAISFLYAALTGLSLWSHKLYWIASVFGGGPVVRGMHPWGGMAFAVLLGLMFRRWSAQMRLDASDRAWLKVVDRYAVHDETGVPESGRFNAGQKLLFWAEAAFALTLFATGAILWFPEIMPRALRLAAVLLHPLAAIGAIGGIIVHIYMGTAAVPGAFRGMMQGWVTERWAASHHAKWFKEVANRK